MRLNPDCIRDILLFLETILDGRTEMTIKSWDGIPELEHYSHESLSYHIRQCDQYGFLYGTTYPISYVIAILDLTPSAHAFLANAREDVVWEKTKEICHKAGTNSLSALIETATRIIDEAIECQF